MIDPASDNLAHRSSVAFARALSAGTDRKPSWVAAMRKDAPAKPSLDRTDRPLPTPPGMDALIALGANEMDYDAIHTIRRAAEAEGALARAIEAM